MIKRKRLLRIRISFLLPEETDGIITLVLLIVGARLCQIVVEDKCVFM